MGPSVCTLAEAMVGTQRECWEPDRWMACRRCCSDIGPIGDGGDSTASAAVLTGIVSQPLEQDC